MEYTLLELDFIDFKVLELIFEKSVPYKHKRQNLIFLVVIINIIYIHMYANMFIIT